MTARQRDFYNHFYSATRYRRIRVGTSEHDSRAEPQLSATIGYGRGRVVTGFESLITRGSRTSGDPV